MRIAAVALCAALVVVVGCSGEEPAPPPAKAPRTVLGIIWDEDEGGFVVRLDPRTLQPRRTPRVPLGRYGGPWAFSPDRSQVAFGGESGLRVVDLSPMRVAVDVRKSGGSFVDAIAWPEPGRVLGAAGFNWGDRVELMVFDPIAERLVLRRPLRGSLADWKRTDDGLLLLLGPRSGIGPARLVLFAATGEIRIVRLARVEAGFEHEELGRGYSVDHFRTPGVALDLRDHRAFVVSAREELAEVDLPSMRVRYHGLAENVSLLGRLRDWLEPRAQAKGATDGWARRALWLGNGLLAIYGGNDEAYFKNGSQHLRQTPGGLRLVDTRDWSVRTLDSGASGAKIVAGALLAYGSFYTSETGRTEGDGLRGYDLDGRRRFHLFPELPLGPVEGAAGPYFYAGVEGSRFVSVIDVRSGRVLHEIEWPENVELLTAND